MSCERLKKGSLVFLIAIAACSRETPAPPPREAPPTTTTTAAATPAAPAALSGAESVGIVRFLMRQPATPRVAGAIHAAVAWLERVRLPDGRWARFYEFGTNRPIFAGRDGVVRYNVDEIERERREGYAWFGTWPKKLLEQEYPAWKTRTGQPLEF